MSRWRLFFSLFVGLLLLFSDTWKPVCGNESSSKSKSTSSDESHNTKQSAVEALRLEGDARLSAGDYASAIRLYTQALDSAASSSTTTTEQQQQQQQQQPQSDGGIRSKLLFKRAEVHFLQRHYSMALRDLENLQSTDAQLLRARIHQKLGDLDQSLAEFNQILTQHSPPNKEAQQQVPLLQSAVSSLRLAQQAISNKEWTRCVDVLASLLTSSAYRDIVRFRLMRAECAFEARNQAELRNELNRIFASEPENVDALLLLAKSLYRLGATEEALSYLKKCTRYDPDNRKCREFNKLIKKNEKLWSTAEDSFNNRKFAEAILQFQNYLSEVSDPFNKDIALARMCHSHVELRQADEAIRVCSQLADSVSENFPSETLADVFIDRAEAHILKDDLDSAARDASRAGEFNRNSGRLNDLNNKIQRLRRMAGRKDFYKILGVSKTSSDRDITKAYRRLATIYHPDRYGMSEETKKITKEASEKRFKEIVEAHETLTDPEKRRRYDLGEDMDDGPGGAHHPHHQPFHHSFFHGPGGGQTFTFHF